MRERGIWGPGGTIILGATAFTTETEETTDPGQGKEKEITEDTTETP